MNVIVTFAQWCVKLSTTMPVSLKLASKELLLNHQIGKTSSKPLICTGGFHTILH